MRALERVRALPWQCTLIGSASRDPGYADEIAGLVRRAGLEDRIRVAGECADAALLEAYAAADLFVLPSHYEGYGMVVAEAIAAGLPVLATSGGALAATLPPGAGVHVPPGDVDALAGTLAELIGDRSRRLCLRDGARLARASLRSWTQAGEAFAAALAALAPAPAA